jgi:hypothetical protein
MAQPKRARERHWIPASLVAMIGVVFLVVGIARGGTDLVDGVVIGVLAFLVAGVMASRRGPKSPAPDTAPGNESEQE